jgi:Transglycosylase-like domain
MRTRIALVAIIPIALITVSTLAQAAPVQSAQAVQKSSAGTKPASITAKADDNAPLLANPGLLVDLIAARPVAPPTPAAAAAPAAVAPAPAVPAGPVDTVTPEQRAEWSRVAMCEEGGDWASDGSRFSGGLGITRDNWVAYGGEQYAPEGAMATEDEQIMVAERIQFDPPDQYGCRGW